MKTPSSTLLIIGGGALVTLAMILVLILLGHDPSQFVGYIGTIVAVTGLGGILGNRVDTVQKQTNGTLSAKDQQIQAQAALIASLHSQLAAHTGVAADPGSIAVNPSPVTPDPTVNTAPAGPLPAAVAPGSTVPAGTVSSSAPMPPVS